MEESIQQILIYLRAVWQRRWLVLSVTALVCAIGWPLIIVMPDTYRASARIELQTQSTLKSLLSGIAVNSELTQQTAVILQNTILTRPNLEKIARAVDLDHQARTSEEFDALIKLLGTKIQVNRVRIRKLDERQEVNDVFSIEAEDSDPRIVKRLVEETLTLFVEKILGVARKDTKLTEEFLAKQIEGYEAKLVKAETQLKDFKRRNVGSMPVEGVSFYQRLSREEARLEEARLGLDEAVNRRDEIRKQIDNVVESATSDETSRSIENLSPLETRIQNMQVRLDDLLLQYTIEHPEVISTQRILDRLKEQRAQQREKMKKEGGSIEEGRLLASNPVYQELKVNLGEQETEIAALKVRIKLYLANVSKLKGKIDTIPAIEAELTSLNRDYNVLRTNYEELIKRRESAKLSYEAETKGDDISFKIIEPPVVPFAPTWPNRPLLETGVLFLGFGLGAGLAILLMMMRPTFSTATGLKEKFGLPVFGTVSMVASVKEMAASKMKLVLFAVSSLMLFVAYGLIVASQLFNINLLQI